MILDGPLTVPVLAPIPSAGDEVLGRFAGSSAPARVVRGSGPGAVLYCAVPALPGPLLRNLLRRSGVRLVLSGGAGILRADSRFIAVHTRSGGRRRITLPVPSRLPRAESGKTVGEGVEVWPDLPPNSTTLLEYLPPE